MPYTIFMHISTIFGNAVSPVVQKRAERRFQKLSKRYHYDPNEVIHLQAYPRSNGWDDFHVMTLVDEKGAKVKSLSDGIAPSDKKAVIIGTIRMGFGHWRIALSLASAAHALGYTPYWLDFMAFPDTAATKTIKHLEGLYNLGSRISQKSKLFNKYVWEYITSSAARNLPYSVSETAFSEIFRPLFHDIPKDMPFLSTHPWTAHAAVTAGLTKVVSVVPDNFPLAFHLAEGSLHAVQSPSSYMGYRTFLGMGKGMDIDHCLPSKDIMMAGHFVDHEIVSNIDIDCEKRLERLQNKEPRRFLLTMGGAGAQVMKFADIIHTCKSYITDKKAAFFINMGDHKGRWADLKSEFKKDGIPYTMHTDWNESRNFAQTAQTGYVEGIHIFLHDNFYAAVYATNLLMRVSDVMITKPSELAFYPVPKLFIQRVGRHEAWGAIRGAEIGDGTIETNALRGLHRTLRLLIEENDLIELYCDHIVKNNKAGIYNGAYNAVNAATHRQVF